MTTPEQAEDRAAAAPSLLTVAHESGRIGCVGPGGPPAHIALLA
jgi:chromate transporter